MIFFCGIISTHKIIISYKKNTNNFTGKIKCFFGITKIKSEGGVFGGKGQIHYALFKEINVDIK